MMIRGAREMTQKNGAKRANTEKKNTEREGETLGSVGPFVKVTWNDAASTFKAYRINANNPSEHLTVCETVGEMVAKDDKAIVLVMHGSQCDGCDIMAIPTDWAQKIEIMEIVDLAIQHYFLTQEDISIQNYGTLIKMETQIF